MAARMLLVFVVAAVVTAGASAQEESSGLSARQLFFKPSVDASAPAVVTPQTAPKPTPPPARKTPARPSATANVPVPSNLGLRYSIVQPTQAGTMDEVDEQKTFRSGEKFALMLESNEPAYLYVIAQADGNWDVLYPDQGEPNRIKGRTRVQIPPQCSAGGECFKFDQEPGAEHMFVVLSQTPEPDLDRMIRSIVGKSRRPKDGRDSASTQLPGSQVDALRNRLQLESRGIVRERVNRTGDSGENAVYIVHTGTERPRVITEIVLNHR